MQRRDVVENRVIINAFPIRPPTRGQRLSDGGLAPWDSAGVWRDGPVLADVHERWDMTEIGTSATARSRRSVQFLRKDGRFAGR
jgi:hypothetical protein